MSIFNIKPSVDLIVDLLNEYYSLKKVLLYLKNVFHILYLFSAFNETTICLI